MKYRCRGFVSFFVNNFRYYRDFTLPFVPMKGLKLESIIEKDGDHYGNVEIESVIWDVKLEQFEIYLATLRSFPLHPDWKTYEEPTK